MPSVDTTFASLLQDVRRLDHGIALGDVLDEVIRCIPFRRIPECGESLIVPRVVGTGAISALSGFRAVAAAPTAGTPTGSSVTFTLRRLDSISQDDLILLLANRQPNDVSREDQRARHCSLVRALATALMQGTDSDATGFLGWENMSSGGGTRTDVAFIGNTAVQTLETLLVIDDACKTGELGGRATAYVTTARGRRNIEVAAYTLGVAPQYRLVHGLTTEVPFVRGRPVLVASGLVDDTGEGQAPVYAVDFTHVFIVATTGSPSDFCLETQGVPLQATANLGPYQWFHGACIVRHPAALVRSLVTLTLSP